MPEGRGIKMNVPRTWRGSFVHCAGNGGNEN
jgi:hypothetical protein